MTTDLRLLDLLQRDASLSNVALAELAHLSPPTCLRRIKRLREPGPDRARSGPAQPRPAGPTAGPRPHALVEVTLDRQGAEHLDAFEARVVPDPRCSSATASPRARLVLVVHTPTCRPTWRWRSGCSPATPMCAT
jgi:Lrp/AsnC family transcriptional regulator, leucine-responsive regulatory protein